MGNANSGPRRPPNAVRILRGVTRQDRLRPEITAPGDPVVKPTGLSPGGSRVWDEMAGICIEMKTLTVADTKPFIAFCELQATFEAVVATKGSKAFDIRQERECAAAVRPYYDFFGMTPVSRARIALPTAAMEDAKPKWMSALA